VLADVVFTDATFNPANYTQTATFALNASISVGQCASCGDPGQALQFNATFGDTTQAPFGSVATGVLNNGFLYNPATQGAILAISASVDKDAFINEVPPSGLFTNRFRPMIEQGGNFYVAVIDGPSYPGGDTGFNIIAASGLHASDFHQLDFSTGATLPGTPDFASGPMLFGIGQVASVAGFAAGANNILTYDNLVITVVSVPEPPTMALFGAALLLALAAARRRAVRG
jgi:hypothetical protein